MSRIRIEDLPTVETLTQEELDAIFGAGRRSFQPTFEALEAREVTDAGWLPRQHQVGLTGRAIAPRLYVGLAISGAMEHLVGLRRAGTIVAINKNPKAPILKAADLTVLADVHALLPHLEAALRP